MKKILSFLMVFTLVFALYGVTSQNANAEATEDVTIYIHVNQTDGDYTNTGAGIWDGVTWNNWADVVTTTDSFGGVIMKTYTAAEINAVGVDGGMEIEVKPTKDVTVDDAANYLAPVSAEGKVFADVTSLKDGSATELHLYYVEGALDFYVPTDGMGLIFAVYVDPKVAADVTAYDLWNIWTWGNGTGGSLDGTEFAVDMEVMAGDYVVPAKLAVIEVDADADTDTGFIVRTEEWAKQCGTDIFIDNTSVRGSGAMVYYYQAGSCEFETDAAAYIADIADKYEMNAGNRFLEGTVINTPESIMVELLMPKNPAAYEVGRFMVKDADGNSVPVLTADVGTVSNLGAFTSDVTCAVDEYKFVLYVETTLDHSKLGIVGSLQGWDIDNLVMSTKDDENGMAVFEICSTDATGEYKVKFDGGDAGFTWDAELDPEITPANQAFDLTDGMMGVHYLYVSDIQVGGFTSALELSETEKHVKVYVDTDIPLAQLGIVGDLQGWDLGGAILPSGVDALTGFVIFEFKSATSTAQFIILNDVAGTGFDWSQKINADQDYTVDLGTDLIQTVAIDVVLDTVTVVSEADALINYSPFTSALTIETVEFNHFMIYLKTDVPFAQLGIAGDFQGWNPGEAIAAIGTDSYGHVIFEFKSTRTSTPFVILNDADDNGFTWDDSKLNVDENYNIDLGEDASQMLYIDAAMDMTEVVTIGSDISDLDTTMVTLTFAPFALMYGTDYMVEYVESDELTIMSEVLPFITSNDFVEPNIFDGIGTYAVSPTEIQIEFVNATTLMDFLRLYEGTENMDMGSYNYTSGGMGAYTPALTCGEDENLLLVHFNIEMEIGAFNEIGLVGSVQGWNPDEAVKPTAMDDNGNWVFEVCVASTEDVQGFKILHEGEAHSMFAWGDPELTPGNVEFTFDGDVSLYVEEGNAAAGSTMHTIMLDANLDVMKDYKLKFTDANGFAVFTALNIDNEAPVITATIEPGVAFEIDNTGTFSLMDYFQLINVIDNRDGEVDYTITQTLDLMTTGEQTVIITAMDSWMNTTTQEFTFTVNDVVAPVLTLTVDTLTYMVGDTLPDWTTYATTDEGTITIDASQADITATGSFFVIFTAEDAAGNKDVKNIEVTVEASDVIKEVVEDTGCFSTFGAGSAIILVIAALSGGAFAILRKRS